MTYTIETRQLVSRRSISEDVYTSDNFKTILLKYFESVALHVHKEIKTNYGESISKPIEMSFYIDYNISKDE